MDGASRAHGEFASWIEVLYTDTNHKPAGTVDDMNGCSADINKGFDGDYVWLKVHKAEKPSKMMSRVWVDKYPDPKDGHQDLAKGSGGDFRYVEWSNEPHADHYLTDIFLWRTDDGHNSLPDGFQGISGDINHRRSGDYLYLIWRTKQYVGPRLP